MKKELLLFSLFLLLALSVEAQDVIVTADSEKIEAKIVEVTEESVKYKKFSYLDGPDFVIKTDQIVTIIYQNGEVQVFQTHSNSNQHKAEDYSECLEDIDNMQYEVEDDIVLLNSTGKDFSFKLFGDNYKLNSMQLLFEGTVSAYCDMKLTTPFSGGRLDHFSKFKVCPVESFDDNMRYGNVENKKMYISIEPKQKDTLALSITDDADIRIKLTNEFFFPYLYLKLFVYRADNLDKYTYSVQMLPESPFSMTVSFKQNTFLNALKILDGDAIIEIPVIKANDRAKDKKYIRVYVRKSSIDRLISDYESKTGKTLK